MATGIAVAVLAANNPIGLILSAILFGAMDAGAMKMSYGRHSSTMVQSSGPGHPLRCLRPSPARY